MDSTIAHHRHHRQRTRAREPLLSQEPLNLDATTRSPRLIRAPRLQHNHPSIVEPHRLHGCHSVRGEQLVNRHRAQHLTTPLNSPGRHLHHPANTAIRAANEVVRCYALCRLSTRSRHASTQAAATMIFERSLSNTGPAALLWAFQPVVGLARPKGLPSESRQIAHRSPGWMISPPSSTTRSSAVGRSVTLK